MSAMPPRRLGTEVWYFAVIDHTLAPWIQLPSSAKGLISILGGLRQRLGNTLPMPKTRLSARKLDQCARVLASASNRR
jgi:hypothetical protein